MSSANERTVYSSGNFRVRVAVEGDGNSVVYLEHFYFGKWKTYPFLLFSSNPVCCHSSVDLLKHAIRFINKARKLAYKESARLMQNTRIRDEVESALDLLEAEIKKELANELDMPEINNS